MNKEITNKTFNLEDLGRSYARCIFYTNNEHKLIKKYPKNNNEADEIIEKVDNPIIVFNPDLENKNKIKKYISSKFNKDKTEINIEPIDIILELLPLITNIEYKLDRNNKNDMGIIKRIIEDPSESFECVMEEMYDIITEIGTHYVKQFKSIIELPKEEREKIFKQSEAKSELSEKEKKKLELQKQLEELEKENNEIKDEVNNIETINK